MEKENKKIENKEEMPEKTSKLTNKQKEIILTVSVLLASILIGFFIGKYLFELMY